MTEIPYLSQETEGQTQPIYFTTINGLTFNIFSIEDRDNPFENPNNTEFETYNHDDYSSWQDWFNAYLQKRSELEFKLTKLTSEKQVQGSRKRSKYDLISLKIDKLKGKINQQDRFLAERFGIKLDLTILTEPTA